MVHELYDSNASPETMNTFPMVICWSASEVEVINTALETMSATLAVIWYGVHEVLDMKIAPKTMSACPA